MFVCCLSSINAKMFSLIQNVGGSEINLKIRWAQVQLSDRSEKQINCRKCNGYLRKIANAKSFNSIGIAFESAYFRVLILTKSTNECRHFLVLIFPLNMNWGYIVTCIKHTLKTILKQATSASIKFINVLLSNYKTIPVIS